MSAAEALAERIAGRTRADADAAELAQLITRGRFLRVVSYHNTSPRNAARLRAELLALHKRFVPIDIAGLDRIYETGTWLQALPALIPAVYEGWRNHYDVLLPLLEEAGVTGWFFVPSFFPDVAPAEQEAFAKAHGFRVSAYARYEDGRYAMDWKELHRVADKHEICCHSGTHARYDEAIDKDTLRREIVDAKHRLEDGTGKRADVFCWNRGADARHSPRAMDYLREAGYRYLMSNLKLERLG